MFTQQVVPYQPLAPTQPTQDLATYQSLAPTQPTRNPDADQSFHSGLIDPTSGVPRIYHSEVRCDPRIKLLLFVTLLMYPPLWALAGVGAAQHGEDAVAYALKEEPVTHDGHSCHSYVTLIDEEKCDMMKDDCVDECRKHPDCNYIFDNKVDSDVVQWFFGDSPCNGKWQCKMLRECDLVPTGAIHDKVVEVRSPPPAEGTATKAPVQEWYSLWHTLWAPICHVLIVLWAASLSRYALVWTLLELVVVLSCATVLPQMRGRSSGASVDFRMIETQNLVQLICFSLMFGMLVDLNRKRGDILRRLASMRDREKELEEKLLDRVDAKGRTLDEKQIRETTANIGIALVFAAKMPIFVYTRMMTPDEKKDQSVWMQIHNGVSETFFGRTEHIWGTLLATLLALIATCVCSSFLRLAMKSLLRCARSSTLAPADELRTLAKETRVTAIAVEEAVIAKIAMHDQDPERSALQDAHDGESKVAKLLVARRDLNINAQQSNYVQKYVTDRALDVLERKITKEFETQQQLDIAHVSEDDAAVDMAFDQARARMNEVQEQGTMAASAAGRAASRAVDWAVRLMSRGV